jgi:hypothetical protein
MLFEEMYTNIRAECAFDHVTSLSSLHCALSSIDNLIFIFGGFLNFRPYISITLKETTDGPFTELHFL